MAPDMAPEPPARSVPAKARLDFEPAEHMQVRAAGVST